MTIEQKAKAYDKALERAQALYNDKNEIGYANAESVLEEVFPLLKESKDERIRKEIINYFAKGKEYLSLCSIGKDDILAWLEKQGESYTKRDVDDAYVEGMALAKHELEKQGEQKPTDKVEPKFKVKYAGNEYNVFEIKEIAGVTFYGIEDEPNHIDYVKAENCEIISVYAIKENSSTYLTKPAVFSEKKPKRMISAEAKEAMYDKPACAWSEKDENILEDIKEAIINYWGGDTQDILLDWLKSLKERRTWKPSDEQMKFLQKCIEAYNEVTFPTEVRVLSSLYNDLKKLREE